METVIICSCVGITVSLLRFNYNQHLNIYIEEKQSPFLHESREEEIAFVMAFGRRCMSECDTHESYPHSSAPRLVNMSLRACQGGTE